MGFVIWRLYFLRAVALEDLHTARKMQHIYDILKQKNLDADYLPSAEYRAIKDHAVELVHVNVQERVSLLIPC